MKHTVILLVTLTMLVKPLWPIMEYVANYEYITQVLCENKDKPQLHCNGKCYLAKQLEKQQKDQDKNPFGEQRSKPEIQPLVFFQSLLVFDFGNPFQVFPDKNYFLYQGISPQLFICDIPHPPETV
ncbi:MULTISPECIES: hypothetical protein [Flagellimonas]|uniref:Uncharacterized protein n=1 Tax=Flagellimonas hadalis TaxID=2597517 RepID=A0A5N5ILX0_9FLAO|nr:hypothetical protein [Allomuricauda hadalis]KAB5486099.1 hypothetical protein FOT42_013985 [Allomuricauda hadalis]RUA18150.1 MAG: hypothetical protein DSY83_02910 [Flavobacteriia bacterium]